MSVPEKVISATALTLGKSQPKLQLAIHLSQSCAHAHTHTRTVKAYRKQRQKDCSKFKA